LRLPQMVVFVFGGQLDLAGNRRYRHRTYGWELVIEPHGLAGVDLVDITSSALAKRIEDLDFSSQAKEAVASVAMHIKENYETIVFQGERVLPSLLQTIFDRIPGGSKLVIVLDHERVRADDGTMLSAPWVKAYGDEVRTIIAPYPFVGVVSFADYISDDSEVHIGGNHYDRMVYHRMAEGIASAIRGLRAKAGVKPPGMPHHISPLTPELEFQSGR
jgi:hypothetical protein